jgi:hypothetical protein
VACSASRASLRSTGNWITRGPSHDAAIALTVLAGEDLLDPATIGSQSKAQTGPYTRYLKPFIVIPVCEWAGRPRDLLDVKEIENAGQHENKVKAVLIEQRTKDRVR